MRGYAALDRLVLRNFDKVIGVSEVPSDILKRWGVAPDRIATILNGVNVEHFESAVPTLRNEISASKWSLVGLVGRLVPDKGGALLLRAAQQVLAFFPKTIFVLVGEGPARKDWEALALQLGIRKQVLFTGIRHDMRGVYASLDAVVLPSRTESMPMCLLEAMAAGKPVVATRVGAVPKLIISERCGLLIDPGDVNGLAAAILRLLGDSELASRMGKNGRARIAEHFSAGSMARNYIRQFEEVLERRNGSYKQAALEVSAK
jgi:glycosyltransferase involved in cell wall biosynthesis